MLNKQIKYLILGLVALTALSGCEKRTEGNVVSKDETYFTAEPPELFTNQVTNQVAPKPVIVEPEYKLQQDVEFCLRKGNEKSIFCGETR